MSIEVVTQIACQGCMSAHSRGVVHDTTDPSVVHFARVAALAEGWSCRSSIQSRRVIDLCPVCAVLSEAR
jgi:hypothetical protein